MNKDRAEQVIRAELDRVATEVEAAVAGDRDPNEVFVARRARQMAYGMKLERALFNITEATGSDEMARAVEQGREVLRKR